MINGTFYSNLTFVLPNGASNWAPQIVLTIVVKQVTLPDNDYRLKVVVTGGIYDTITFRIG
jgi:archaellum component FlaG (FlaF/FlaG flagellin family)